MISNICRQHSDCVQCTVYTHKRIAKNYKHKINKNKNRNELNDSGKKMKTIASTTFIECQITRRLGHGFEIKNKIPIGMTAGGKRALTSVIRHIYLRLCVRYFFGRIFCVDYSHFACVWISYTWKANKLHQLFNEIESHFTFQIWATAGEWVMIEWKKKVSTDFLALTRFASNCSVVFSTSLFGRSIDNVYDMMGKYNKKTVEMLSLLHCIYVLIAWFFQLKNYDVWKNAIKSHK